MERGYRNRLLGKNTEPSLSLKSLIISHTHAHTHNIEKTTSLRQHHLLRHFLQSWHESKFLDRDAVLAQLCL